MLPLLVVGLGNPGSKYSGTRHNLGFDVVDQCIQRWNLPAMGKKFQGEWLEESVADRKVFLMKPHTFMNLSGNAVAEAVAFYKIESQNVLVVSDDLDIPAGTLRIRKSGGAGGHNGLKSLISALGENFPRVRIGIGRSENIPSDAFVLMKIPKSEQKMFEDTTARACEAIEKILSDGIDVAMNQFNQRGSDVS